MVDLAAGLADTLTAYKVQVHGGPGGRAGRHHDSAQGTSSWRTWRQGWQTPRQRTRYKFMADLAAGLADTLTAYKVQVHGGPGGRAGRHPDSVQGTSSWRTWRQGWQTPRQRTRYKFMADLAAGLADIPTAYKVQVHGGPGGRAGRHPDSVQGTSSVLSRYLNSTAPCACWFAAVCSLPPSPLFCFQGVELKQRRGRGETCYPAAYEAAWARRDVSPRGLRGGVGEACHPAAYEAVKKVMIGNLLSNIGSRFPQVDLMDAMKVCRCYSNHCLHGCRPSCTSLHGNYM